MFTITNHLMDFDKQWATAFGQNFVMDNPIVRYFMITANPWRVILSYFVYWFCSQLSPALFECIISASTTNFKVIIVASVYYIERNKCGATLNALTHIVPKKLSWNFNRNTQSCKAFCTGLISLRVQFRSPRAVNAIIAPNWTNLS